MDKRLDFTGINPDIRLDQILIDPAAHRLAIHALLSSFAVGTNPNFIISGCVVTVGGAAPSNTWDLTAGYIYLNGEVVQVESQSGTFNETTQFLAFSKSVTYDPKGDITYNDGTPRQTWQKNRGVITVKSSVLVTELDAINGDDIAEKIRQYIGQATETAIGFVERATATERDAATAYKYIDASLLAGKDGGLKRAVLSIGVWDMDATASVSVSRSTIPLTNIRSISVMIRNDDNDLYTPFMQGVNSGSVVANPTHIVLTRAAGGTYDNTNYDGATFTRGYIVVDYIP